MNTALEQIKTAYESEKMSPLEIAEDQSLDVVAVKSALIQCSSKYRQDMGMEDSNTKAAESLNFTKDQLKTAIEGIYELAITTEDEHLKRKLYLDIIAEHKGRNDIKKLVQSQGTNIFLINSAIQRARESSGRLKDAVVRGITNTERKAIEA